MFYWEHFFSVNWLVQLLLLMPSNNLARCGIPPTNKDEKKFRLGQHLSKAISETDASLKKVA